MEAHGAYLKRMLKGTLLSRKVKLLQQLNAIVNVGHRFGETTRRLEEKTALDPVPLEDPATGAALLVSPSSHPLAPWKQLFQEHPGGRAAVAGCKGLLRRPRFRIMLTPRCSP